MAGTKAGGMRPDRFFDTCAECGEDKLVRVCFKGKAALCAGCYSQTRRDPNRVGGRRDIVDVATFISRPVERTTDSFETPARSDKEYREMAKAPAKVEPRALVLPPAPPGTPAYAAWLKERRAA